MSFALFEGMSKQHNVNPNFYKVGGSEHAESHGEAIRHDQEKQHLNTQGRHKRGDEQPLPGNKEEHDKR